MKNSPDLRLSFLGMSFAFIGVLIVARMVYTQTNAQIIKLRNDATKTYSFWKETIQPERGNIYDRWGHLLAGNDEVYELGIDLSAAPRSPETIARDVAGVVGLDYGMLLKAASMEFIKGKQEYVLLESFVTPEQIDQLDKLRAQYDEQNVGKRPPKGQVLPSLNGLIWRSHLKRSYPEKTVASNILGFYAYKNLEKSGAYFGIEQKYDDLLSGSPVEVQIPYNPTDVKDIISVPAGASLVLTIDREIQSAMERILDKSVESSGARSGTIIVMDPKTGEILAMASNPRIDLNKYWDLEKILPKPMAFDKAVGETYEPGSVFKVLTMGAAIDAGVVTPDTEYIDTGIITVGGAPIYNWDGRGYGPQTMVGCLQHSLNVCLAWVATQLGPEKFYMYMNRFGIGHLSNIDVADEVIWPFRTPGSSNWYEADLGANAYGQGVAVTPIQLVTAISSMANDGKIMAPHLLKAIITSDWQYTTTPQVIGQPVTAQTAHTITEMLATSLEGEASTALVDGYRMAGKTGTGSIPFEGSYLENQTNASFVGWGPVDDPRFIVYIWLERPSSSIWASIVAAPIFHDVVEDLVFQMNIPPDEIRAKLYGH